MSSESDRIVSAEVEAVEGFNNDAALRLQKLGFKVLHIGPTISVQAPRALWESVFHVTFEVIRGSATQTNQGGDTSYLKASKEGMRLPEEAEGLVSDVMFVEPPEMF